MHSFKYPVVHISDCPVAGAAEMQVIDDAMLDAHPQTLYQMMEHAGTAIAEIAGNYTSEPEPKVAVLVGKGNNGGGALVAARHLANHSAEIQIILTKPLPEIREVPRTQLRILTALHPETPVHVIDTINENTMPSFLGYDIIIDGLLGYNISGTPRDPISSLIVNANNAKVPIISVDIPSGLHPDTGHPAPSTISAAATITLALPKTGFLTGQARPYLGDLFLAKIGIPPSLIQEVKQIDSFELPIAPIIYLNISANS